MDLVLFLEAKTAALIGDHWHFFLKMKYFSSIKLWNSCQSKMHCFRTKREISLAPSFKLQHEHQILSDIQIMIRELSIAKGQYQQIILFKSTISISCLPRKNPSSNAEKKKNCQGNIQKINPSVTIYRSAIIFKTSTLECVFTYDTIYIMPSSTGSFYLLSERY